jgi:hypothetical protein
VEGAAVCPFWQLSLQNENKVTTVGQLFHYCLFSVKIKNSEN